MKAATYVFKSIPKKEGLFGVEKKAGQKCVFFHKSVVKKYLIFPLCVFLPNGRYISMKHSLCLHTHTHTQTHTHTHECK